MEDPTNPQNSKFFEDLQKASQEIETDLQKKKPTSNPLPVVKNVEREAPPKPPLERSSDQDLIMRAEEIIKEKKRLEEIQKNLERNQKQVTECIQELTTIQGEISRVLEGKKKIEEDLRRMREKNKKIFEGLGNPNSL